MKKCIVIGGGFAGLTSAAYLVNSGINIELLEASQKLGGRAYSFKDKETGLVLDNGQHIMMGCYKETLKFFDLIGAKENLLFQDHLKVNFVAEGFKIFPLNASKLFYPFNLLLALLNYKAISLSERLKLLKFFLKLYLYSDRDLEKISVYEWIELENQNENIRKAFWEILAVGALNTNINKVSAKIFSDILKQIFFRGNKAAAIILPKFGLTGTYCNKAQKFIEEKGGTINLSEQVLGFEIIDNKIISIKTSKREIKNFDYVISAIPFYALEKILSGRFLSYVPFKYSAILSCHVKLKEKKLNDHFYGFINSKVHWVFNHENHLTIVISDANNFIDKPKEELFEMIISELEKFIYINRSDISSYKILKEKRATFIPSKDVINNRNKQITDIRNLFLAGDWVDTNLPSTIESAVKSGRVAADFIL